VTLAYTLQAILARSETFTGSAPAETRVVPLECGISMLPLGRRFLEAHSAAFLPLTDGGEATLPSAIGGID
jgi:hypothetical protein